MIRRRLSPCLLALALLFTVGCTSNDTEQEPSQAQASSATGSSAEGSSAATSAATSATELREQLPLAFTPIVGSIVGDESAPVLGTDGSFHVVYELWLTNARQVPATIDTLEVVDFDDQSRVLASFTGAELAVAQLSVRPRESRIEPDGETLVADDPELEPNESMLAFIELTFDDESEVPDRIVHRLAGTGATNPGSTEPAPTEYLMVPWDIAQRNTPVIGPPLAGDDWVAVNGCCSTAGAHRTSVQTLTGELVNSQRFAIDWMQIGENGTFFEGDPDDVTSWYNYDQPVLAVADGTVVEVLDELPDQPVGTLPDPETITLETVDGNHVILDLGNGVFAFYAHLRAGSIEVSEGDVVTAGQELGRLGNSGNTSAPHLHLHLMAGPSAIGSDGVPMAFDEFELVGGIDPEQWEETSEALDDEWTVVEDETPGPRNDELPLDLAVVDFE